MKDTNQRTYGGLDRFRLIAAALVIAIHTGPLLSVNEAADFALAHILARVAVPFFLMVTGFFFFPTLARGRAEGDGARLGRILRKTAVYYGVSILLYLPVNIYTFRGEGQWPGVFEILQKLFFTGTMYHLW